MGKVPNGPRILIVGGGSGGHISPGIAVAEALRDHDGQCHVLCSERSIDRTMLLGEGMSFQCMPARPFSVRPLGLLRCLQGIRRCTREVTALMKEQRFDGVLALGGFVAASVLPGILSARRSRLNGFHGKIVLLNLDRIPGKANRQIARHADVVVSAVDTMQDGFATMTTGLPIREAAKAKDKTSRCRAHLGLDPDRETILITGASQGASSLNRLMIRLLQEKAEVMKGFQFIHISGHQPQNTLQKQYESAGIKAIVQPFMQEIGCAWGAATMAISRAGANSVAEIQANAVPAILLPYPHHRDQHQVHNAMPLVDAGGSLLVTDDDNRNTAAEVGSILERLGHDSQALKRMSAALAAQARPKAAQTVVSLLLGG